MKTNDAIYYGSFMAGMIIGTLILRELGVTGILQLIGGVALGVGVGYAMESAYDGGRNE